MPCLLVRSILDSYMPRPERAAPKEPTTFMDLQIHHAAAVQGSPGENGAQVAPASVERQTPMSEPT